MERLNKPYLLRLFAVAVFAGAVGACDEIATTRVLPQVWEIKGDAFVLAGGDRRALTTTAKVGAGDVVETAENASALIALMPGIVLQVNAALRLGSTICDWSRTAMPPCSRCACDKRALN